MKALIRLDKDPMSPSRSSKGTRYSGNFEATSDVIEYWMQVEIEDEKRYKF